MKEVVTFLSSALGLLLIGSLIGTVGLFTWQRQDWLFKQKFLGAQVMLDRRLNIIEKINADVGRLLATAMSVVVVIRKQGPADQRNDTIQKYNDQQVEWFAAYSSHEALLVFYFSRNLSEAFISKVVGAYENVDIQISKYRRNPDNDHYANAYYALQNLRSELRSWNSLALNNLHGDYEEKIQERVGSALDNGHFSPNQGMQRTR